MSVPTDPIADFLTQIRNAASTGKPTVTVRGSKMTQRLCDILMREGFIENVKSFEEGRKRYLRIHLKYAAGKRAAIQSLVRISRPGLRRYVGCSEIPRVLGGLGVAILSTPKGVMTDREARTQKTGGELLCTVW